MSERKHKVRSPGFVSRAIRIVATLDDLDEMERKAVLVEAVRVNRTLDDVALNGVSADV